MSMPLDERSRDVLRTLIQAHIATGEPVGSESLARLLHRSLSPATLRSVMADLERSGFLDHPHTSAGRIPTDEGYRLYVDDLMGPWPMPALEARAIESEIKHKDAPPEQVFAAASHVLSRLSAGVGFVLAPDFSRTALRHVHLARLAPRRVLVVLVSLSGVVTSKAVETDDDTSPDELLACANYVNAHFAGCTLAALRGRLLELMQEEKALYDRLLQKVAALAERAFAAEGGQVYLDGTSNILGRPEFEDAEHMRALFQAFEEKSRLVRILNACLAGPGPRVTIGREIPDPELHGLAVVTSPCPVEGETGWALGVMGSTRMEYPRVVAVVDCVARTVASTLKGLAS